MTLRDYTLIAVSLTTVASVAKLIELVPLPWWLVLAPVVVLAVAVGVTALRRTPASFGKWTTDFEGGAHEST